MLVLIRSSHCSQSVNFFLKKKNINFKMYLHITCNNIDEVIESHLRAFKSPLKFVLLLNYYLF